MCVVRQVVVLGVHCNAGVSSDCVTLQTLLLCVLYCQVLVVLPGTSCIARCSLYCQVLVVLPGASCIARCSLYCQVLVVLPGASCIARY